MPRHFPRVAAEAAIRSVRQAQAEDLALVDVDQLEKVLPQLVGACGPSCILRSREQGWGPWAECCSPCLTAPGLLGAPTPTAPAVPVKTKPCAHISVASGPSLRSWQMLCCSRGSLSCC